MGNDLLHEITSLKSHDLFVIATDFSDVSQTKRFSHFTIGSEEEKYKFDYASVLPGYSQHGLFQRTRKMNFSTIDQDNDPIHDADCAEKYHGGWWYSSCHKDSMNGKYFATGVSLYAQGVHWLEWKGHYKSLKSTLLMIKPMI